jgi:hypothetical protein
MVWLFEIKFEKAYEKGSGCMFWKTGKLTESRFEDWGQMIECMDHRNIALCFPKSEVTEALMIFWMGYEVYIDRCFCVNIYRCWLEKLCDLSE